ncbi:hypothetical protein PSU4_47910 [Pseudonocardia sulfidoxydans NBRC 16205]|uniref:Uncharacterized protein n=1 Tax=Pseudonocardia sulfidoxydans NBRC 16205 TaxID=1223511 RepID=A0A511DN95_9PSEU|nr:hypothetical protein [Pseudonocardia sulfidoxydans]GEL25837.1 hypothetical protein PSU4_47910 [Pseudonocardia sulfidoxydans NBRC 16205]
MDEPDVVAAVARRRKEIAARLEELRTRRRRLADPGTSRSTAADVESAERSALAARHHAEDARQRVVQRHELSVRRHLEAAAVLAAAGDQEAAARHRAAAAAAREVPPPVFEE